MFWNKLMTDKVRVELGTRSYDILIGYGLLEQCSDFLIPILNRSKVAIVTDETVAAHHLDTLVNCLSQSGIACDVLRLPAGEMTKSWPYLTQCVEWLLDKKVERQDVVIALGGGVMGDLVGFAAAILRRGIRFVQIPTSLLAQVDSSVGGKTGINTLQGKNLIGAFHQPSLVLTDISVLETMSQRDFLAGYGEVVKYGLLGNAPFFEWLEEHGHALTQGNAEKRAEAVRVSCQMKADIVARDETEQGERALLNLGHTFCHALEAATGYSDRLLHGEGVAIGCGLAFELSARVGLCAQELPSRVRAHLKTMGMKVDMSDIPGPLPPAEDLLALMGQDKKVVAGELRFILARDIGDAFATGDVDRESILSVLSEALSIRG
jgi:3-dehydroquinate synthase